MSTLNWKSATSGNFNDATRWDTGDTPGAGDVANIGVAGSYTITVNTADTVDSLNFSAAGATLLETVAGSLTLSTLKLSQGTVVLHNANTIGNYTLQTGGLLEFFNSGSLGAGTDYLTAGEQTAMANATLSNNLGLFLGGASTTAIIDAAAGTTLDAGSGGWTLNDAGSPTLQFGSTGNTGTVIWDSLSGTVTGGGAYKLDVAGGTLEASGTGLRILTTGATSTTVASGATLDLAASSAEIHNLFGSGSVIASGSGTDLQLDGAAFSGTISGAFFLAVDDHVSLSGINTYTVGTALLNGTLGISNSSSLGTGALQLAGGELLATANATLSQNSTFTGSTTVAATHGTTLTLASANMAWDSITAPVDITFGDATHKGTVVLAPIAITPPSIANPVTVTVADGTLELGSSVGSGLISNIATLTVAAGATLDTNGSLFDPNAIVIAGTVTNSSATAADFESLTDCTVSGAITGNLIVQIFSDTTMILTGASSYTGGTTIDAGAELDLGNGSAGGTILAGLGIVDGGSLVDNHSAAETLSGTISGSGSFTKNGSGATTLSGTNTYSGGATLNSGELIVTNSTSLGTGALSLTGGELLASAGTILFQNSTFTGTTTVAAATATTLSLDSGTMNWDSSNAPVNITFGDATHKGTVILGPTNESLDTTNSVTVTVADGTLQLVSNAGNVLLSNLATVTVAAGATLDTNGVGGFDPNATVIAGTLTNSSITAAEFVSSGGSTVSGAITGNLEVLVFDNTMTLTGTNSFANGIAIGTAGELDLGNGGTGGSILAGSAITDNGSLVDDHSSAETLDGIISGTGSFTKNGTGATTLSGVNTYSGGTTLNSGELIVTNSNSPGTGPLDLTGGELLANATVTLPQDARFTGNTTVAAATAITLTLASGTMTWDSSSAPVNITFGDATHKGTVVLDPIVGPVPSTANNVTVTVADGILRLGSNAGSNLISNIGTVTVAAGATLDTNGILFDPNVTVIAGTVTNSSATGDFFESVHSSTVSGAITGNLDVEVDLGTMTLTGANSYTLGTLIFPDAELDLGNGGAGGTILAGSAINDNGSLVDDHSSVQTLSGVISGIGSFTKDGTGITTLGSVNTYSGGTTLNSGELIVTNANSLGTGALSLTGGELLATAIVTLSQNSTFTGNTTIAAATGQTLTLASGTMTWDGSAAPVNITFGDATHKGTVVLDPTNKSLDITNPVTVTVADGTLQLAGSAAGFSGLVSHISTVTVDAGATLDVNGFPLSPFVSVIDGTLTNSSATVAVFFASYVSSTISGAITGNLSVQVADGTMTLTGANSYTNDTVINLGAELDLGNGGAGGTILAGLAIADDGLLVDNHSSNDVLSGVISGVGSFTKNGSGATTLGGVNSYSGGTTLNSGKLIVTNNASPGTGAINLKGGELLSTANVTLSQNTTFTGITTVAAATAKTLALASSAMTWDNSTAPVSIIFGDATHKGAVLLNPATDTPVLGQPVTVTVADGTLQIGSSAADDLLSNITSVTVAAGATLDIDGFNFAPNAAVVAGTLTNSSATAAEFESQGASTASGAIGGNLDLLVYSGAMTLTGANSYTRGTTIDAGATLNLGNGGTGGTILAGSTIADNGALVDNHSAAETLSGILSGTGSFTKNGTGATTLSGLNTYRGGTTLNAGELIVTNAKSLGTGALSVTGGELVATATMVQSHALHTGGTDAIAAAHGKTLALGNTSVLMDAGKLVFGDTAGDDGTVVFKNSGALTLNDAAHITVEVQGGTLAGAADNALSALLKGIAGTAIDSGATLDAAGHALSVTALTGAGALINSSSTSEIASLYGATNFAGAITGKTNVDVFGNTTLSGNESFAGALTIEGAFTVRLQGLFAEAVKFAGGSGTLALATPANFTGIIQGFQAGTTIDLRNLKSSGDTLAYNTTTHILIVSDGTNSDQLHFNGSFVKDNFAVKDDGSGHVDLIFQTGPTSPEAMAALQHGPSSIHDTGLTDICAIDFGQQSHHSGDWIG